MASMFVCIRTACLLLLLVLTSAAAADLLTRLPLDIDSWNSFGGPPGPVGRLWDRKLLRHATGTLNFDQLSPVIRKLNAGLPIVVMAVGSSITAGYGGHFQQRPGMLDAVVPMPMFQDGGNEGWLRMFVQLINTTWPHADHLLYNAGKGATSFLTYAQASCLEAQLPNVTVDLLVAEFKPHKIPQTEEFADGFLHSSTAALEQFMRRIFVHFRMLQLPPPAYAFLRPMAFGYNITEFNICTRSGCRPESCTGFFGPFSPQLYHSGDAHREWRHEERVHSIVKYYGHSSLSIRYLHYAVRKSPSMRNVSDCNIAQLLYRDSLHPTLLGQVLYADLLINLLADTESHLAENAPPQADPPPSTPLDVSSAPLLPSSVNATSADPPLSHNAAPTNTSTASTPFLVTVPYAMPEYALTAEGWQVWQMRCYGEVSSPFRTAVPTLLARGAKQTGALHPLEVLLPHNGWSQVINQTHLKAPGDAPKHKPGWVSSTVGITLRIRVNTEFLQEGATPGRLGIETNALRPRLGVATLSPHLDVEAPRNATVTLLYLQSYEHMGTVRVECVEHCTCASIKVNAHNSEQVSVSVVRDLVGVSPHPLCTLGVTILDGSTSPDAEHKFKLIQVVVKVQIGLIHESVLNRHDTRLLRNSRSGL